MKPIKLKPAYKDYIWGGTLNMVKKQTYPQWQKAGSSAVIRMV